MRLSAGTREPLLHVFRPPLHSTRREQTRLTRKAEKCKFLTDLWPLGGGGSEGATWGGGCPACIQTRFKQSLWLHYLFLSLITSPPISGHWEPLRWSRHTRHHSFTCLRGAFVRWLLAEKGKQINTSPMGLTGNLYLGWNMSGTGPLDSLTVTGQLTGLHGSHSSTSWPLENHFGACSLVEVSLWGRLITRKSSEVLPSCC